MSINDVGLIVLINEGEKNFFKLLGNGIFWMGVDGMKRFLWKKVILSKVNFVFNFWWFK